MTTRITRREIVAAGPALLGSTALPLGSIAQGSRTATMNVVDTLAQRNQEFARTRFAPELKIVPLLRTLIIGCVDPRVADCGIKRLGNAQELLASHFGVATNELAGLAVMDPSASIAIDIAALRADPRLSGDVVVSGLIYDVNTGKTTTAAPPALLRPKGAG